MYLVGPLLSAQDCRIIALLLQGCPTQHQDMLQFIIKISQIKLHASPFTEKRGSRGSLNLESIVLS